MTEVTGEEIRRVLERVPAAFRDMPQFVSEPLSAALGRPVLVKAESANPIGCFKGRGTWLAVEALVAVGEVGERSGLVAASAGNFGQGVAYAGSRAPASRSWSSRPRPRTPTKVAAMRRLGAEVRLAGEDFDAAREAAAAHAVASGWRLIIDGQDPWIAIGAGTMAVELTDAVSAGPAALEALYVPVGNGALISGVGTWLKSAAPATRVIGVQAEGRRP